jgi:hypothetical protein
VCTVFKNNPALEAPSTQERMVQRSNWVLPASLTIENLCCAVTTKSKVTPRRHSYSTLVLPMHFCCFFEARPFERRFLGRDNLLSQGLSGSERARSLKMMLCLQSSCSAVITPRLFSYCESKHLMLQSCAERPYALPNAWFRHIHVSEQLLRISAEEEIVAQLGAP